MATYKIRGIDVRFPFEAYDCQLIYMERVISALQQGKNALLESPTGTGKTLCLLCATLAWQESLVKTHEKGSAWSRANKNSQLDSSSAEHSKPKLPTIIYSSRTHSQLQQVVRELKASSYRPKMVVLGSREQMCIHKDVSLLRGRAQNHACRSLCKTRSCSHQTRVADYLKVHPDLGEEPIDIEDLVAIGKTKGPCPYYMSRELHNSSDILFVPYNYLIEKENRNSLTGICWENAVIIFDEAHNLEGICADAASLDLPSHLLAACIQEAKQCVELASLRRNNDNAVDTSVDPDNFAVLKALLLEMEKRIRELPLESEEFGLTKPGAYIYDFLSDMKITWETVTMLIDNIDYAVNLLEDDADSSTSKAKQKLRGTTCRLQSLRDALRVVFRNNSPSHAEYYRVHVHVPYKKATEKGKDEKNSRTLSWWCFNPGIAMEAFATMGVRSIILTSGTLAPLDSFAAELNLAFEIRLENPHVIEPNQIWVGVIPSGPSGRPLNSSYQVRDSLEYKLELGNALVNFARIVPNGLLVFFPSYYVLSASIEAWQTPAQAGNNLTVWERICKHKQPVVEPKESALFNQAHDDFVQKVNKSASSGAVFFAVCRGKVSEGLDFADHAGRAVIVTGIPYAMKTDPKVRLKREYLNEQSRSTKGKNKGLTGDEWYVQQAARAVNQAIGRVIRHKSDYGAIILCDERFAHGNAQTHMSLWLRPYMKCYSKFGDAAFTLTRFFREKMDKNCSNQLLPQRRNGLQEIAMDVSDTSVLPNAKFEDFSARLTTPGVASSLPCMDEESIFVRKTTVPLRGHCTVASPEPSFSATLIANRAKRAKTLHELEIVPANQALRVDPCGITPDVTRNLGDDKVFAKRTQKSCIARVAEPVDMEPATIGAPKEGSIVPATARRSDQEKLSDMADRRNKNAAEFLKMVQAYLAGPEYKRFLGCMRGIKGQHVALSDSFEIIYGLFSAPERSFLLHRFVDFVPKQYQTNFEQYIAEKQESSTRSPLSQGADIIEDTSKNQGVPSFSTFPPRSRKKDKLDPKVSPIG